VQGEHGSSSESRSTATGPEVPGEAASSSAIEVSWSPKAVNRWQSNGSFEVGARIRNNSRQAIEARPRLVVRDATGRSVEVAPRQGATIRIRGGRVRRVVFTVPDDLAVSYTSLPASVDVGYRQQEKRVVVHSPVHQIEYAPNFQRGRLVADTPQIIADGVDPLSTLFRELDAQTGGRRVGVLPDGSEVQLGRLAAFPEGYLDRLPLIPPRPVPTAAHPYVLCFGYEAEFDDGGGPDDYLNSPNLDAYPGAFSTATALAGNADVLWSGQLDADGCTPPVMMEEAEKAALLVRTEFVHAGTTVKIRQHEEQDYEYSMLATFKVPIFANEPVVQLSELGNHYVSRSSAVIARMMSVPDSGLVNGGQLTVLAEQNCPGWPLSACYWQDVLYLGPNPDNKHATDHKYVIAHEFGHAIAANYGALVTGQNYVDFYENELNGTPECQCGHVPDQLASHCLQSSEDLGNAVNEGFAHFLAAKAFNENAEADCSFAYYKDYLDPNSLDELEPPVWVDCTDTVTHRNAFCGGLVRRGTEHDWMNFFWALHTDDDQSVDIGGLGDVLNGAQNYPVPEAAQVPNNWAEHWCGIDDSAAANLTAAQHVSFQNLAMDYGVWDPGQAPCD